MTRKRRVNSPRHSESEIRTRVADYLSTALSAEEVPALDIRHIAKHVACCSPTRIYQYRLDGDIRAAQRAVSSKRRGNPTSAIGRLTRTLNRVRSEAVDFRRLYETVLHKLLILEHRLRQHPYIDLDEIYRSELPRPARNAPMSASRRSRVRLDT